MFIQNLLSKLQNFRKFYALHGYKSHFLTRQTFTSTLDTQVGAKRFATNVLPPRAAPPGATVPAPSAVPPKIPAAAPPIAQTEAPQILAAQVAAKTYAANPRIDKKVSTLTGLREFFMHPLAWDRNNGYFNILLGLAIFGYCFCTACTLDKPDKMAYEPKDKTK